MAFAKLYSAIGKQTRCHLCLTWVRKLLSSFYHWSKKFDGLKNKPPNHKVIHLWKKGDIPRFEVWTNHGG